MARNRGGDWKGKRWFEGMQNIQLCSALKLALLNTDLVDWSNDT